MRPYALAAGEGTAVENPVSTVIFNATGAQTGGGMAAIDTVVRPAKDPRSVSTPSRTSSSTCLTAPSRSGSPRSCEPGAFIFIPRGTPHTWKNAVDAPARFYAGFVPANPAFEEWFTRYAKLPAEQCGTETFARLAAETQPFEVPGPTLS